MRQLLRIFLFVVLCAPIVGSYLFLQHQKKVVKKGIKRKMISGIDKKDLVLLSFSKAQAKQELKWKHSKEFQYKDDMYDVVDFNDTGDSISYWCWWDHEETKINKELKNLLANALGNNPDRKKNQEKLIDFFKLLYLEQHTFSALISTIENQKHLLAESVFISRDPSPFYPPPRLV